MANHETNWLLRFIDEVTKPLQGPKEAAEDFSASVDKVTASLDTMDKETRETAEASLEAFGDLTEGIKREEKQLVGLKQRLEDAGDALDPLSKGVIDFDIKQSEAKIRRYKEQLTEVGFELDELAKKPEPEKVKDNFTNIFTDLKKSLSGIFDDLASGNIGGIEATFKTIKAGLAGITRAAWAFITTPIGAAIAALAAIGMVANDFLKYNKAAREANIITQQLTQITGDALGDARIRGEVIAKTFGQDFKKTLEIAKSNVQAFGVSYNDALDSITEGLVRGGMSNASYYSSLGRYPKLFANAGFTMQEFQRVVNTGIDLGMYSDKLPKAVKEFGTAIKRQTDEVKKGMEGAFGEKFTARLFKNITDGSISPKEALKEIAAETKRVGVNATDAAVLTRTLFRGAGEDAGGFTEIITAMNTALDDTPRALTAIEQELNSVAEANYRLAEAKREALESDSYMAFAASMESFWTEIKIGYYNFLTFIREWFDSFTKFGAQMVGVIVALPKVIKDTFLNVVEDIGILVETVMSAGKIIDDALNFRWGDAKKGFQNFKSDLKEDLAHLQYDFAFRPKIELQKAFIETGLNIDAGRDIAAYFKKTSLDDEVKKIKTDGTDTPTGTSALDPMTANRESTLNGGGGRGITMELTVNNYFNVKDGTDIMSRADEIIDMVVGGINSRVKDGLIAATA